MVERYNLRDAAKVLAEQIDAAGSGTAYYPDAKVVEDLIVIALGLAYSNGRSFPHSDDPPTKLTDKGDDLYTTPTDAQKWPEAITFGKESDLLAILGRPNFACAPFVHLFRKSGRIGKDEVPTKAEAEQAWVIHWLLGLWFKHGAEWSTIAAAEMDEARRLVPPTPPMRERSDV